jgi:hypothetical protein
MHAFLMPGGCTCCSVGVMTDEDSPEHMQVVRYEFKNGFAFVYKCNHFGVENEDYRVMQTWICGMNPHLHVLYNCFCLVIDVNA